jgi:hypothetical protein
MSKMLEWITVVHLTLIIVDKIVRWFKYVVFTNSFLTPLNWWYSRYGRSRVLGFWR